MRQSRSFEEAVNAALAERSEPIEIVKKTKSKKKKKPVEEAVGAGRSQPSGLNTIQRQGGFGQMSGRRGQNPPYSFYSDVASSQVNAELQSPEETEAPKIFPYPLENVTNYLANAFLNLKSVESQIDLSFKNPMVTKAKRKELESVKHIIKSILGNVKKIGDNLQKIVLD